VLIICGYALKFPRVSSWRSFLAGMLHNMSERDFSAMNINLLCPVVASVPGGLLNVMPVCCVSPAEKHEQASLLLNIVELKSDSAGMLNGRPVAVDYGTY
jgi:hypothetical protein